MINESNEQSDQYVHDSKTSGETVSIILKDCMEAIGSLEPSLHIIITLLGITIGWQLN